LDLATKGYTDDMISHKLGIGKGTVNTYWVRIRGKLGHSTRSELVAHYVQRLAKDEQAAAEASWEARAAKTARKHDGLLSAAHAEIDRLTHLLADRQAEPA
jgi:hypothetical protein